MKHVLFWGRYGNYGPDYPRNRVIDSVMRELGCRVSRFVPLLSPLADIEYAMRGGVRPDVVWVPCFRQRDLPAAARYARRQGVALVFDPLISAYDKQVSERRKFAAVSAKARRLLAWESRLFNLPDFLVADTAGHADYFHTTHGVPRDRLVVIPVGAEEALFAPVALQPKPLDRPLELVFFGTFIGLQGVDVLARAIRAYSGQPVRWRLIGEGPLRAGCEQILAGVPGVSFEAWVPLPELPGRLASADAILGIFGSTDKSLRVIPNKVYQGLALSRPVITARTPAYPAGLTADESAGILWAEPGDEDSICAAVARLIARRQELPRVSAAARQTYETHFSNRVIADVLRSLLKPG